jgi:hypothetical protein
VAELAGAFRPLLESPEVLAPVIASLEKSLEDPLVVADTHARVAAALQLFAGIADPKGLVAGLHDKLILTTPLKTLASKEFSAETGIGISAPASLRLGAAGFLRSLGQEAARPGWSLADLPVQESFWQNDLQLLAPATRLEFLNLVRELSTGSSIETREQLLGLFHLLRETGEHHSNQAAEILAAAADRQKPQGMQRMVGLLLDEVLMDPSPEPPWLPVAEILIGRLDFTGLQALQLELSPLPVEPLSTSPPQNEQISTSVISVGEANDPLRREKRQRLLDVVCAGLAEKEQSSLHRMLGFLGGKGEKCSTTPESQSGEKNTGEQDDGSLKKMFLGFKKLWKGR